MSDIYLVSFCTASRTLPGDRSHPNPLRWTVLWGGRAQDDALPTAGNVFNIPVVGSMESSFDSPKTIGRPWPRGGWWGAWAVNRYSWPFYDPRVNNNRSGFLAQRTHQHYGGQPVSIVIVRISMANSYSPLWSRRERADSGYTVLREGGAATPPYINPPPHPPLPAASATQQPSHVVQGRIWVAETGTVEWIGALGGTTTPAYEWLEANVLTPPTHADWYGASGEGIDDT